ncbi:MAG: flagellar protein FlaG [Methylococcales bacterium]|nr:flagellar protein FlaG [Methylococcales bacterium]
MSINNLSSIGGEATSLAAPKKTNATEPVTLKPDRLAAASTTADKANPTTQTDSRSSVAPLAREAPESTSRPDNQEVEQAVASVNAFFQNERRQLSFSVNDTLGSFVIEVRNAETEEVIRQIPPEAVVELAERLQEQSTQNREAVGVLLKEQA